LFKAYEPFGAEANNPAQIWKSADYLAQQKDKLLQASGEQFNKLE